MKRSARKFHRRVWTVLGVVLPLLVLALYAMKQSPPVGYEPRQIVEPEEN